MKTIDHSLLDSIAGGRGNNGGDRADNSRKNKGKNNGGNKSGSSDYYTKNTSEDCINGMVAGTALGAFGGLPGAAMGLVGGGNKCGSSSGGKCSW